MKKKNKSGFSLKRTLLGRLRYKTDFVIITIAGSLVMTISF
jgi:hypothetical protein